MYEEHTNLPTIKDITFTESGVIISQNKKKKTIEVTSNIHILGYKMAHDDLLSVVYLEYGILAEAKTKEDAINSLISMVQYFLKKNTKKLLLIFYYILLTL